MICAPGPYTPYVACAISSFTRWGSTPWKLGLLLAAAAEGVWGTPEPGARARPACRSRQPRAGAGGDGRQDGGVEQMRRRLGCGDGPEGRTGPMEPPDTAEVFDRNGP